MFDLLLGAPGETKETVKLTIERVKNLKIPLVGAALGVRLYPDTPLGNMATSGLLDKGLYPSETLDFAEPTFYLSPELGDNAFEFVRELIGKDQPFLMLSAPGERGSYNYADNEALCKAISEGARGTYWDILQKKIMGL